MATTADRRTDLRDLLTVEVVYLCYVRHLHCAQCTRERTKDMTNENVPSGDESDVSPEETPNTDEGNPSLEDKPDTKIWYDPDFDVVRFSTTIRIPVEADEDDYDHREDETYRIVQNEGG